MTSEFNKINKNRPDHQFTALPDHRFHHRRYLPPIAFVRTFGKKKPQFVYLCDFMVPMKCEKAANLQKYCYNKEHQFIRFDYTDHGDSYHKLKTANEPIDDKTPVLSPFPGPKPLKHTEKMLDFNIWKGDIIEMMDEFSEGPQVLIGEGFGLWMALLVAIERPDKVKGVIGISGGVDMMARYHNKTFNTTQKERIQAGETIWLQDHPDGPFVGSKKLIEDSKQFELLTKPGKIPVRCPVRLVHTYANDYLPHRWLVRLADRLMSQDVDFFLKKTGHHKMTTETDYELIYKAIDSMLTLF